MEPQTKNSTTRKGIVGLLIIAVIVTAALLFDRLRLPTGAFGRAISGWSAPSIQSETPTASPTRERRPTRTPGPSPTPSVTYKPGQLLYVRHETASRGQGLPDTYRFYLSRMEPAAPGSALREYIRGVQRLAAPNMSVDDFEANMAAFWADNRALSNGHSYEEDFAVGPVITGGAMVRATGNSMFRAGHTFVEVYALDPLHLPPVPASLGQLDWTLHFRPTIVTRFLRPDGRWLINPFPQFDGWGIAPLLGRGGRQWLDADYLVPIAAPVGPFDYP